MHPQDARCSHGEPSMRGKRGCIVVLLTLMPGIGHAGELPDASLTPGAVNQALSEDEYHQVCHEKHWTKLYRPPVSFTNSLKRLQIKQYSYVDADSHDYEEDHLVPLCLVGAPEDPHNLWPEPRTGEWSAAKKDKLEAKLCRLACDGKVDLKEAQHDIASDWIAAYQKYVPSSRHRSRE